MNAGWLPDGDHAGLDLSALQLLRLLQLTSPALPVGGFAFSHGLEAAVAAGWVRTEADLATWLDGVLSEGIAGIDVPLLARCHAAAAAGDTAGLQQWNDEALAWRETSELQLADIAMGGALARLLRGLPDLTVVLPVRDIGWVAAFASAAVALDLEIRPAALAYFWSVAENQITCALKLMPIGQSAGQRLLLQCSNRLPVLATAALARADEAIGSNALAVSFASAWHETQYSRLFRS